MMMLSEAAQVTNGKLIGSDVFFSSVSKDTRQPSAESLYVAIKGERFDGHEFLDEAVGSGAVAALVSEEQQTTIPQLKVGDTKAALRELAQFWRRQYKGYVIGITGSNGKTTVKEMCRSIMCASFGEEHVLSTKGNLNNDIGLPLTILEIEERHSVAVLEMGANHVGEIRLLTQIAKPNTAIVTNVGAAHIEGFGSVDNIAKAKAEIFEGLDEEGIAVLNFDDRYFDQWASDSHVNRTITFSLSQSEADVYAKSISGSSFTIATANGEIAVNLNVPGEHNILNAIAAAAIALSLDIGLEEIKQGLENFEGVAGRLRVRSLGSGANLIDDTYNANPNSLSAGIDVLMGLDKEPWLVLGAMGELGSDAGDIHRLAGESAKRSGIKRLFAIGPNAEQAVVGFGDGAQFFEEKTALIDKLKHDLNGDVAVLVKGSRFMQMEQVVSALFEDDDQLHLLNKKPERAG